MGLKNEGKRFEEDFQKSCPKYWLIERMKDSSASWSHTEKSRFTPKNTADFILVTELKAYFVECKSFLGKSMNYSLLNDKKDKKLNRMCEIENNLPITAGAIYVLNFRELSKTYIVSPELLRHEKENAGRKSFSIGQAMELGRLVPQRLVRVRWRYDLEKVFA